MPHLLRDIHILYTCVYGKEGEGEGGGGRREWEGEGEEGGGGRRGERKRNGAY